MSDEAVLRSIEAERGVFYGAPRWNHENIGIVWGGLLRAGGIGDGTPVPPDLVVLMMGCGVKGVRAAQRTPYHADDYADAHNYIDFADRFRKEDFDVPSAQNQPAVSVPYCDGPAYECTVARCGFHFTAG